MKPLRWLHNKCRRRYKLETHFFHIEEEFFWSYKRAWARHERFKEITRLYVWAGFGWLEIGHQDSHKLGSLLSATHQRIQRI